MARLAARPDSSAGQQNEDTWQDSATQRIHQGLHAVAWVIG
jgi:hypothetical protein